MGRVHAKAGEYDRAIDKWMEKMPLIKTPLESTWLFHEIGRCHLELKNFQDAKEYGQKSLAAAQEADDQVWQLNATVLIAQAEGKTLLTYNGTVQYRELRLYCHDVEVQFFFWGGGL